MVFEMSERGSIYPREAVPSSNGKRCSVGTLLNLQRSAVRNLGARSDITAISCRHSRLNVTSQETGGSSYDEPYTKSSIPPMEDGILDQFIPLFLSHIHDSDVALTQLRNHQDLRYYTFNCLLIWHSYSVKRFCK
ncbi:unnamed protein product [Fusarium fujikuroi]|uniref:Uncharacterized protein n=1 Tax=Fusarium fujikuroi TaxID=5127 RepID=A0A9Q9UF88_FUSFU|nr:unnamed protein product [Fusarium fujikuroi]VZH99278.1 unnamed protein product [Fusarium fujikuroi]